MSALFIKSVLKTELRVTGNSIVPTRDDNQQRKNSKKLHAANGLDNTTVVMLFVGNTNITTTCHTMHDVVGLAFFLALNEVFLNPHYK
mmetsp:Transcript_13369/g.20271  ORF Transcript_13369/g.20271 Transcript_13369/m.20271 type:complete len:88 (-) Transcript_13369:71-334(-)